MPSILPLEARSLWCQAMMVSTVRGPVGAGNSAVVVDVPRWGPMMSPRVPHHVPIPSPRMERETLGQRRRLELWAPTRTASHAA